MNKHETSYKYIIASFIGLLLVGTAIYAQQTKSANPANSSNTNQNITSEPETKRLAPNFTLDLLNGGSVTLADFRGKKPVVLDFFATWCPNCRRDMPHLNGLYEKYKDQIEVIGVDLQEQAPLVEKFVTDLELDFPIALDINGAVARQYGVRYTNFHILIDKEGKVIGSIPGDIKEEDFIKLINL